MIALMGLEGLRSRILGSLSPGERQRALLARAFLQSPKVLILDEPTNHLDPEARHGFWAALEAVMSKQDCRVLLSTHDLVFAKKRAAAVLALNAGEVVFAGSANGFWDPLLLARTFGNILSTSNSEFGGVVF